MLDSLLNYSRVPEEDEIEEPEEPQSGSRPADVIELIGSLIAGINISTDEIAVYLESDLNVVLEMLGVELDVPEITERQNLY